MAVMLLAAGCTQPAADDARAKNPEKYDHDHSLCAAQVNDDLKSRRMVDTTRRDVFRDDRDRYGQGALPAQMDAYGDAKSSDRLIASCMAARGWPQPDRQWWQKIGR
ncbi:hypothetical protein [Reyranella sp.]|jgi:hypothetical protein|uniref:hypothetical protein n=1 Tax=Reyranella sp. TaxID=1929291 RepID=UPI002F9234FE